MDDHSRQLIDEMNRYYDHRAPWHDDYMSYTTPEAMKKLLKPIIDSISDIVKGRRVLEVACGTGSWTHVLARLARSVTATDVSPKSLDIARAKLGDFDNISIIQHSAYELNQLEGTFEVVFAADWWSHVPMAVLPHFLQSSVAKLDRDSHAIFMDISFIDAFKEDPRRFDLDGNQIFRRTLPDGTQFDVVKNFPDRKQLARLLSPFTDHFDYLEFEALDRWMLVFSPATEA